MDGSAGALEERIKRLEEQVAHLQKGGAPEDRVSLVCFSGEWDRLFAAFTIANGALALGQEVHIFFTFWAVSALRKEGATAPAGKSLIQQMLSMMLPGHVGTVPLSKMHFGGMGKAMLGMLMKEKGVDDLGTLMKQAKEMGAHFHLCETSSGLFGLDCKELVDSDTLNTCGVATFLSLALKSRIVLFI
ncbi:MAG: DsrE/DsrF/DrsH-like family protein [Candidatus Eremiobacteraeota bacterium]|nr:DsrE/DsrF/DrsH-like family protein [Candidatus Eremiobacteraeota bacterium]